MFSGLLLALLAIAFLLQVDFIFYILYVCLGVYLWSRWYFPRTLHGLERRRVFVQRAFWGEKVSVRLVVRHNGRFSLPWLQIHESVPVQLTAGEEVNEVFLLRGRETAEFVYHLQARRRGYYKIGPLWLKTGDLFGLIPEKTETLPPDYLTIYPRIIPLGYLGLPSRQLFGTISSQQRLFADPTRPMGVRDYRSGDPIRQIHWKASGHTRKLVVKTYEPAISLETAVVLNLCTTEYTRYSRAQITEWAIEVAASLAAHLVNQRQPVGLLTNGIDPLVGTAVSSQPVFDSQSGRLLTDATPENAATHMPPHIPPRSGRAHLMKILEQLARIEAAETIPLSQWLIPACMHLNWGIALLIVTPKGDEATCQTIHRLVRTGLNPILLVVEPDANFGRVRERAAQLGFVAYHVAVRQDLDRWKRPLQVRV